jgi:hypothetical protein
VPLRGGHRPNPGAKYRSTRAEAPRPARNRINGRSPGSRVVAFLGLPGASRCSSGTSRNAHRLQLRGQLRNWDPWSPTAFPVRSLARDRRRPHLTVAVHRLSMRTCGPACSRSRGGYSRRCRFPPIAREDGSRWDAKGNAVRATPEAAAAPATVSGEHSSTRHWSNGRLREGRGTLRPASQETCRRRQPQPRPRVEDAWEIT